MFNVVSKQLSTLSIKVQCSFLLRLTWVSKTKNCSRELILRTSSRNFATIGWVEWLNWLNLPFALLTVRRFPQSLKFGYFSANIAKSYRKLRNWKNMGIEKRTPLHGKALISYTIKSNDSIVIFGQLCTHKNSMASRVIILNKLAIYDIFACFLSSPSGA